MPVWDRLVRVLHWSLVAGVLTTWVSGLWPGEHFDDIHPLAGYCVAAVVVIRLIWGLAGSHYARFAQFVRHPAETLMYVRDVRAGQEKRYIGHNPLGSWMVLALLTHCAALAFTGWLYTTDAFWGYGWLSDLHAALAWSLTVLIPLHVGGVIVSSRRHRENLLRAMFTGRKPAPGPHDER
ncbi:cytochrome b/b6 domain-containing protein [Burkholderiaceae bacterium DAT-1]|nr:cytochrome b/b6 domain-containing protein [Burkholderiaceae bacterium DAT-1]